MDRAACPGTFLVGDDASGVEIVCDFELSAAFVVEGPVDMADDLDFAVWSGRQDDPVGLYALVLAPDKLALNRSALINQRPAEAEPRRASLPIPQLDQAAMAGENLGRQLPAVFPGHRALDTLDDGRDWAAVILELLGTVMDGDARPAGRCIRNGHFRRHPGIAPSG